MSNNPFLKPKETNKYNDRFNFLQDDEKSSSFKEQNNKSKKNIKYEQTTNTFTQPPKIEKDRDTDRNIDRNRDRNRPSKNHFKKNNDILDKSQEPPPELDATNDELFPELISVKQNSVNINTSSTKFRDIVTNGIKDDIPKDETISPGWLRIYKVNGKFVHEYGPPTPYMIQIQKEEEKQQELENDPNYLMNCAIEIMKMNWKRYEYQYDEIHGEGAYDRRFRLPHVYGSEYDTESDEEDDINSQEDDEIY